MRKGQKSPQHGGRYTKAYRSWINIKSRCLNPKHRAYYRYGGNGITIHPSWVNNFAEFFAHVGEAPSKAHSIDRVNNQLGYIPGNVRWATTPEQSLNTKRALTIPYGGRVLPLKIWAKELNIPYMTLFFRLKSGKSPADILKRNYPKQRRKNVTGKLQDR